MRVYKGGLQALDLTIPLLRTILESFDLYTLNIVSIQA